MSSEFWKNLAKLWSLSNDKNTQKKAEAEAVADAKKDIIVKSNYSLNPLDDDDGEDDDEF